MQRDFNISIEWSPSGLPLTHIDQSAHLYLAVHSAAEKLATDPSLPQQTGTVSIRGNRAGLLKLAERLIAVAHTDVEGYHEHLDQECPRGLLDVAGDWELVIERSDVRAIRKAKRNSG